MIDRLLSIDRRIVFLFLVLGVSVAMLRPALLPVKPTENVVRVYDAVEALKGRPGAKVLLSFDYDPSSDPELQPTAINVIRQCFRNDVGVVGMALWAEGVGLGRAAFDSVAKEYGKEYGRDFAFLGYKPSATTLIINMGENFRTAWTTDYYGTPTRKMAITADIAKLADFDLVLALGAGDEIDHMWVTYAVDRYKIKLGGAVTAVISPDMFPYLQSGQLIGLVSGLSGAAEYETLMNAPGSAMAGMVPQSTAHIVIIVFVALSNIMYVVSRRRARRDESPPVATGRA